MFLVFSDRFPHGPLALCFPTGTALTMGRDGAVVPPFPQALPWITPPDASWRGRACHTNALAGALQADYSGLMTLLVSRLPDRILDREFVLPCQESMLCLRLALDLANRWSGHSIM